MQQQSLFTHTHTHALFASPPTNKQSPLSLTEYLTLSPRTHRAPDDGEDDRKWGEGDPMRLGSISPTFYEQFLNQYSFAKKIQCQTVSREKL